MAKKNEIQTVKDRLKFYLRSKKISERAFASSIEVSSGYVTAISKSIQPDKLQRISIQYPDLDQTWLLTGKGEMLRNPYLEKPNDIVSNVTYASENNSQESLLRIGLRLSEVARLKHIDPQGLADRTGIDYHELMDILTANKPATDILIIKIAKAFPDINPYWLSTGQSTPFIKDLLPEMEIDNLPEKLAAAEKRLHEKDFVISLQKDTIEGQKAAIEGLKGQVALLEEKTATLQYTERAPSKNDASSKGKTARGNVRATTLG